MLAYGYERESEGITPLELEQTCLTCNTKELDALIAFLQHVRVEAAEDAAAKGIGIFGIMINHGMKRSRTLSLRGKIDWLSRAVICWPLCFFMPSSFRKRCVAVVR